MVGVLVEQQAGQHLVAVQRGQRPVRAAEQPHELPRGERGDRGQGAQVGVDVGDQVVGQRRQRDPEPSDAPRRLQPAGRWPGIELGPEGWAPPGEPEQFEVGGHVAAHRDDDRRLPQPAGAGGAGDGERLAEPVAERRDPQVLLERAERQPERLGDRARAEHGADGAGLVADRRDRPALQQHEVTVVVDRPLDVLRAAERGRGLAGEPDEAAPGAPGPQRGGHVVAAVTQAAAGAEGQLDAVDLPADQPVGSAGHGRHHQPIGAAGDGIGAEEHAAPLRLDERLNEDRDGGVTAGLDDLVHRGEEGLPPADVEERREHPCHRLGAAVLDGRRRPHDDRAPAGGGQRLPCGVEGDGVVAGGRARGEGGGARRGHREPGEDGQAPGPRAGQRGGLGADDTRLAGQFVVDVDHRRELPGPKGGGPEADVRHPCSNGTDRSPREFKTISASRASRRSLMNPSPSSPRPGITRCFPTPEVRDVVPRSLCASSQRSEPNSNSFDSTRIARR